MPVDDIEGIDDLFDVPPDEFVRARDTLAGRLRDEGRLDDAREVRGMRRPTLVVWALNQVARRHPQSVKELFATAAEVRTAQQRRAGSQLRHATRALQAQVSELARRAADLAAPGRVPELEAALRAAALGGDGADELRHGRLQQVPEAPTGAEMWTAGGDVEAAPTDPDEELDRQLDHARAQQRRAEQDLERAREAVERTEARIDELQARLGHEREAVAEAEGRAREARRDVQRLERRRR